MRGHASDKYFLKRVLIVVGVAVAVTTLWLLSHVLLLLFAAVLIAVLLRTLSWPLRYAGAGDTISIIVTLGLLISVVTFGAFYFGGEITQQLHNLVEQFNQGIAEWERVGFADIKNFLGGGEIAAAIPKFLSWGASVGQAIVGIVLVIFGGIYLALNPQPCREGLVKLIPSEVQPNAVAAMNDIGQALHRWLAGLLGSMILVGALTAFALWLAGVKSALILGLVAGFSNIVPYVGSIIAAAITLIVAASQSWDVLLWAAVAMAIVQQIESNIISPIVIGRATSILPVTGLFAIVAMGVLFGPLGVLLGFPLTVVADIAIRRFYVRDTLDRPVEILGDPAERSEDAVDEVEVARATGDSAAGSAISRRPGT